MLDEFVIKDFDLIDGKRVIEQATKKEIFPKKTENSIQDLV
jgi:hypothetical protein